jgi:4-amino-4-deoxy-L-arabinose transferase-like glycosyltransferase
MADLVTKTANFASRNKFLFILLSLVFLVRLPSLFEPFWYGDEAIYAVIGQKILRGGLMYVDIFDHKTPGIYYLTALTLGVLGQTIWSLHFLLTLWVLVTLVVFYLLAKKLFDQRVAKIATIVFALFTSIPIIEGNIFNSEILMVLPISLGLIFGLNKRFFTAGIFFSLAFLLKFPGIFDLGAFFVFVSLSATRKNLRDTIANLIRLTAGFIVPVGLTTLFFVFKGAFGEFLFSSLLFNFSYTNYGNKLILAGLTINNGLIMLKALPLLALVIYFFWKLYLHLVKKKQAKNPVSNLELVILWLAFAYYGAVFGGRPYPHYLIQALPAFSLILALAIAGQFKKLTWGIAIATVVLTIALGFKLGGSKPTYYPNFFRYVTNQIKPDDYLNSFDSRTALNYSLASFLTGCEQTATTCTARTTKTDNIYIWGNSPVIYFLAQRDPTSKYITAFHVAGNQAFKKEVLESIKGKRPEYILVEESAPNFAELDKILSTQYNLFAQTNDVKIYQLTGSSQAD